MEGEVGPTLLVSQQLDQQVHGTPVSPCIPFCPSPDAPWCNACACKHHEDLTHAERGFIIEEIPYF